MQKQEILENTYDSLRRSFAMMSLAIACNMSRDKLFKKEKVTISVSGVPKDVFQEANPPKLLLPRDLNMRATRLPTDIADKLRARVANGDVTCIVPTPEQFTWIVIKTDDEELRAIYGLWVGRPASWRGKIDPNALPHLGAMTVQEAEAKGIPIPNLSKE